MNFFLRIFVEKYVVHSKFLLYLAILIYKPYTLRHESSHGIYITGCMLDCGD